MDSEREETERARKLPFEETSNFDHGVYRYRLGGEAITVISAQTWEGFTSFLSRTLSEDKFIVSPELMTFTGQPLGEVDQTREIIEVRVGEMKKTSRKHPQTLYFLGTPTFPPKGKPRNSVLFIKNGREVGQTNKRSGATPAEREHFDLLVEEPAALVPGTDIGILICADLPTASIFGLKNKEEILRLMGRESFIGKNPTFIHPKARNLLVISCWGVGGNRDLMKPGEANAYYLAQLRGVVAHIMRMYPQIEKVLHVDQVPLMRKEDLPFTPSHPFNALFQRKK